MFIRIDWITFRPGCMMISCFVYSFWISICYGYIRKSFIFQLILQIVRIRTYTNYMRDYSPFCLRIRENYCIRTTSWSYWSWQWWVLILTPSPMNTMCRISDLDLQLTIDRLLHLLHILFMHKFSKCQNKLLIGHLFVS